MGVNFDSQHEIQKRGCDAEREQGSISPTFSVQLLRAQIQKSKKGSQLKQLFVLLGSVGVKAPHKLVDEIDPGHDFDTIKFTIRFHLVGHMLSGGGGWGVRKQ